MYCVKWLVANHGRTPLYLADQYLVQYLYKHINIFYPLSPGATCTAWSGWWLTTAGWTLRTASAAPLSTWPTSTSRRWWPTSCGRANANSPTPTAASPCCTTSTDKGEYRQGWELDMECWNAKSYKVQCWCTINLRSTQPPPPHHHLHHQ